MTGQRALPGGLREAYMVIKAQRKTIEFKLVPKLESGMKEVEKEMEILIEQIADYTTRSLYLALGASILLKEGFDEFVEKAIKKGETSEKDVAGRIRSMLKMERRAKKMEAVLETRIETGVRKVMDTLDIPSKSDVEKLGKRVAELSGRVSKLSNPKKPVKPTTT
jgi:polyhydroxyalkanoate synthesis regulator phasin